MEDAYKKASAEYYLCLRTGQLKNALNWIRKMADVRRDEGCDADEMKLLMLAFHISTSGCAGAPRIEEWISEALQNNVKRNRKNLRDAMSGQVYLDTVRKDTTPSHIMSVQDSRYLFELVAAGCVEDAEKAIQRFAVSYPR